MNRIFVLLVSIAFASVLFRHPASATEVPLQSRGGVFTVPVGINGVLTLNFIIDSGASEVQIPADVVLTLVRTQTILPGDFLPGREYTLADGSVVKSPRFVIRELRLGDHRLANVTASISSIEGEPLLGQSMLGRFPHWMVDNRRHVLVVGDEDVSAHAAPEPETGAIDQPPVAQGQMAERPSAEPQNAAEWEPSVVRGPAMPPLRVAAGLGSEFERAAPAGLQRVSAMIAVGANDIDPEADTKLQEFAEQVRQLPRTPRHKSDRGRSLNDAGLAAFQREDTRDAIARFEEAFREDPADVEVANNLGYAYLFAGNLDMAEQYVLLTLLLAPTRSIAWDNLGQLYALRGAEQPSFACFLNAYRFSRNRTATRKFMASVAASNPHEAIRLAVARVLRSPMLQTATEP